MNTPAFRTLLAIAVLLGTGIAAIWFAGDKTWAEPEARQLDESLLAIASIEAGSRSMDGLEQTAERPLFSRTRRPAPPEAAAAAAADPDALEGLKILGLFGVGEGSGAILQIKDQIQRVRIGQKMGAWTLQAISGRTIVLVGSDNERVERSMVHLAQPDVPPPPAEQSKAVDDDVAPANPGALGAQSQPSEEAAPVATPDRSVGEGAGQGAARARPSRVPPRLSPPSGSLLRMYPGLSMPPTGGTVDAAERAQRRAQARARRTQPENTRE